MQCIFLRRPHPTCCRAFSGCQECRAVRCVAVSGSGGPETAAVTFLNMCYVGVLNRVATHHVLAKSAALQLCVAAAVYSGVDAAAGICMCLRVLYRCS
jgi:hypothetical protein